MKLNPKITASEILRVLGLATIGAVGHLLYRTPNLYFGIFGFMFGGGVGLAVCLHLRKLKRRNIDPSTLPYAKPKCPSCDGTFTYMEVTPINMAKYCFVQLLFMFGIKLHIPLKWKCASCDTTFVKENTAPTDQSP